MSAAKPPVTPPAHSATPAVNCPQCGDTTIYAPSNPYRPFCSARCKGIDLGAWASEQFRVGAVEGPDDEPDGTDAAAAGHPTPPDWRH
ncbi:MAG: DNA gyrase inhibitor YacG [Comamonas sp.]